jgi:hypothetical protein
MVLIEQVEHATRVVIDATDGLKVALSRLAGGSVRVGRVQVSEMREDKEGPASLDQLG